MHLLLIGATGGAKAMIDARERTHVLIPALMCCDSETGVYIIEPLPAIGIW